MTLRPVHAQLQSKVIWEVVHTTPPTMRGAQATAILIGMEWRLVSTVTMANLHPGLQLSGQQTSREPRSIIPSTRTFFHDSTYRERAP